MQLDSNMATKMLLDLLPVPVCVKSRYGDTFIYANQAFATLVNQPLARIIGQPVISVVSASAATRAAHAEAQLTLEQPEREIITSNIRKDGAENIVQVRKRLVNIEGYGEGILCVLHDISQFVHYEKELEEKHRELRRQQSKLKELATIDSLTGIFNRRAFYDKADEIIRYAEVGDLDVGVLMFDLDKFKNLNDSYGHAAGDEVLLRFTQIVGDCIRNSDIFARLGGEEFGLLLPDTPENAVQIIAERIRERVTLTPVRCDGVEIKFTTSVGGTMWKNNENRIDLALTRADKLLYLAKQAGRNLVCFSANDKPEFTVPAPRSFRT